MVTGGLVEKRHSIRARILFFHCRVVRSRSLDLGGVGSVQDLIWLILFDWVGAIGWLREIIWVNNLTVVNSDLILCLMVNLRSPPWFKSKESKLE